MKRFCLALLLAAATTLGIRAQMSQTVSVDGADVSAFVTTMTFSGSNVTLTYDGATAQTADISAVALDFDYLVALDEAQSATNASKLAIYGGKVADVKVTRALSPNYWNTICLPFAMSAEQVAQAFGEGASVARLQSATDQTIGFATTTTIEAGVPYLLKPTQTVASFQLDDIALNNFTSGATVEGTAYSMVGTIPDETPSGSVLYFTTANTLRPLNAGKTVKALHAYMKAASGTEAKSVVPFSIDDTATGIISATDQGVEVTTGPVYNLSGQQVGATERGLRKGIYIVNGKKIVKQ